MTPLSILSPTSYAVTFSYFQLEFLSLVIPYILQGLQIFNLEWAAQNITVESG